MKKRGSKKGEKSWTEEFVCAGCGRRKFCNGAKYSSDHRGWLCASCVRVVERRGLARSDDLGPLFDRPAGSDRSHEAGSVDEGVTRPGSWERD